MTKKTAAKLSLIDLADYPKEKYSAFWEIFMYPATGGEERSRPAKPGDDVTHWEWGARIYGRESPTELLQEQFGTAPDETEARRDSQTWVLKQMPKHKRGKG